MAEDLHNETAIELLSMLSKSSESNHTAKETAPAFECANSSTSNAQTK